MEFLVSVVYQQALLGGALVDESEVGPSVDTILQGRPEHGRVDRGVAWPARTHARASCGYQRSSITLPSGSRT